MTLDLPVQRRPAAVAGGLSLLAIGWTGLLIPSLIRSIEATFDQTDAGIGLVYFLLGNVVLAVACTIALAAVRWSLGGRHAPPPPRLPEPPRAA